MAEGLKLVIDALELGWSIRTLVFAKAGIGNPAVEKVAARTVAAGGTGAGGHREDAVGDHPARQPADGGRRVRPAATCRLKDIRPAATTSGWRSTGCAIPAISAPCIRTVDAVGAKGVILVGDTTDPFSLETVRATMGSVFAVPVARATRKHSSPGARAFRASSPARISRARSTTARVDYAGRPVLLLMGNEQQGLPDELAAACDRLLRIPQAGRADSLNLAVATGVMLFEIRRAALKLAPEAGA